MSTQPTTVPLVDVQTHPSNNKNYMKLDVPIPQAGTYEDEGITKALCGHIFVPTSAVKINKQQENPSKKLGVAFLQADKTYDVRYKIKDTHSVHEDWHYNSIALTGAQLREYNEQYGQPAVRKHKKEIEATNAKTKPGYQLSFDDLMTGLIVADEPENETNNGFEL